MNVSKRSTLIVCHRPLLLLNIKNQLHRFIELLKCWDRNNMIINIDKVSMGTNLAKCQLRIANIINLHLPLHLPITTRFSTMSKNRKCVANNLLKISSETNVKNQACATTNHNQNWIPIPDTITIITTTTTLKVQPLVPWWSITNMGLPTSKKIDLIASEDMVFNDYLFLCWIKKYSGYIRGMSFWLGRIRFVREGFQVRVRVFLDRCGHPFED